MCHTSLMLLESSQGWMLSSWLPGSTVYLHKEIISLSPQYTQNKLYSLLPSILGVEYFADLIEALMMGLWCWKQDSSMFPRPRGAWRQGSLEVSQHFSCPLALHTHSPARLLMSCWGERSGVGLGRQPCKWEWFLPKGYSQVGSHDPCASGQGVSTVLLAAIYPVTVYL